MSIFSDKKLAQLQQKKPKNKKHRILVVDDEKNNLDIIEGLLGEDYDVVVANDGVQALKLINEDAHPERFHLIISDQRMPALTGIDFLAKTIPIIPSTKRIILTAFTDVNVIVDAINKGHIYKFILKPYDRDDMRLTVQRAIETFELEESNKQLLHELRSSNVNLEIKVEQRTNELQSALDKQSELNEVILINSAELKEANEQLSYYANTDALTDMHNRRHFIESSELELSRAQRSKTDVTIMMLDIDHFKKVNDTYGHAAGDEALKKVASVFRHSLRLHDIVGRIGGEEFAILLSDANSEGAFGLAERIRKSVAALCFECEGKSFSISVSIGITQIAANEKIIEHALKRADKALYQSKNNGRNQVTIDQA
jgi:diguanylate cyclase (GGDEF)-like protein